MMGIQHKLADNEKGIFSGRHQDSERKNFPWRRREQDVKLCDFSFDSSNHLQDIWQHSIRRTNV